MALAACRTWGADFTIASSESTGFAGRCRSSCSGTDRSLFCCRRTCGIGCRKTTLRTSWSRRWSGFRWAGSGERAGHGLCAVPPSDDAGAADLLLCQRHLRFAADRARDHRDIGVRYVAANCHPDHDTICTFRRNNFDAVTAAFLEVLLLAKEPAASRDGGVDGTKVDANANKRNSIRYDRAGELREQLRVEIKGLLDRAERDDADVGSEPQGLPEELKRRETRRSWTRPVRSWSVGRRRVRTLSVRSTSARWRRGSSARVRARGSRSRRLQRSRGTRSRST